MEKNLDDLLNHSNITLYQAFSSPFRRFWSCGRCEAWGAASLVQLSKPNHSVVHHNHSGVATVKGTDPKLKALNDQHDNLTRMVHGQAGGCGRL